MSHPRFQISSESPGAACLSAHISLKNLKLFSPTSTRCPHESPKISSESPNPRPAQLLLIWVCLPAKLFFSPFSYQLHAWATLDFRFQVSQVTKSCSYKFALIEVKLFFTLAILRSHLSHTLLPTAHKSQLCLLNVHPLELWPAHHMCPPILWLMWVTQGCSLGSSQDVHKNWPCN